MKVIIHTPGFKASEKLTDFVTDHVEKLSLHSDRIIEAHILLKKTKSATDADKICELKLEIPGDDIFASRQGSTFEDTVMETIQAARTQLKKWKDSINPQKMRPSPEPGSVEGVA